MRTLWYFSADWCGPCKQFGPIMDRLAEQGIPIKKLNIDYTPDASTRFGIKNIPTVILVENEQEIARFTGARTPQQVVEFLNQ